MTKVLPMRSLRVVYRECPGCTFRVLQKDIEQSRIDLACPRCGMYYHSQFAPVYGEHGMRLSASKKGAVPMPRIVSAFVATGKSTFCLNYPASVRDCDSSRFRDDPEFPFDYIQEIRRLEADANAQYILVSTHFTVRDELAEQGFNFVLIYPDMSLKLEYLQRLRKRGSSERLIEALRANWEDWIASCMRQSDCKHIVLGSGQYLSHMLGEIGPC